MLSHGPLLYATFLAQAVEALLVASVMVAFHRHYRRLHLRDWAWAWWALAVFRVASALGILIAPSLGPRHALATGLAALSCIAAFQHVGWLLLGAHEMVTGVPVTGRRRRLLQAGLGLAGVAAPVALVGITASLPEQFYARVALPALPVALAFLGVGGLIAVRSRGDEGLLAGSRFVALGFLLFGGTQAATFALGLLQLARRTLVTATVFLALGELVLLCGMALGTVLWLLDEERRRAARAADHAEHLAHHDALTGLPNRRLFLDRLAGELEVDDAGTEGRRRGAVLYFDLDRFKVINDSLGHRFGDRVLEVLGRRLAACLGEHEMVSRFGGDEFAVLLPGVADEVGAVSVTAELLELVRRPVHIAGREVFVGACVGVSLYPLHGTEPQTLLKAAEAALYGAKDEKGQGYRVFQPRMHLATDHTLSLETRLRRALANEELALFYQPVVELGGDRLVGFEALLRWELRPGRFLRPDRFLPLAESIGLVEEFDGWALATAARQLHAWHRSGFHGLYAAINLSARRFENPDLPRQVQEVIAANQLPAESIELEITETVAMRDPGASSEVLEALKRLGVRVAIDDFGTAYSSLLYLRTFPIDSLKIDRSFVAGIVDEVADQEIAASLIRLAHALGVTVVGEGVESADQLEALRLHGCDRVQGYYLSPPLAAEDCSRLLEQGPWRPARAE